MSEAEYAAFMSRQDKASASAGTQSPTTSDPQASARTKPGLHATTNKYRAKATKYNGVRYDSAAEAARAHALDMLLRAGEIVDWIGQPTVRLGIPENVYRPDFLVIGLEHTRTYEDHADITVWYEDVKGVETEKFRRDKKLWKRYGRLPLRIIRNQRVVEVIEPEQAETVELEPGERPRNGRRS